MDIVFFHHFSPLFTILESRVGDLCIVCSKDTGKGFYGFTGDHIKIQPCGHKYCIACIEEQLDKNTINCGHCNINAIGNGIRLKEHWCPMFKNTMEFYRGIEFAREYELDYAHAAKKQKTGV